MELLLMTILSAGTSTVFTGYRFTQTSSRSPYPSEDSLLTLFAQDALPVALTVNNTRASIPNLIITNSGSQRFDIYAG
ncbi:hypothetical protein H0H93_005227, partial [Arthromyces matolae]